MCLPWVQLLWDSELPGLSGSLFPLPDWGSSPSSFFSNKFSTSCSCSPSGAPHDSDIRTLKVFPEVPKPLLIFLNSCFFILFWLFLSSFCSKLLIWVLVSFLSLLFPYRFFFISHNENFFAAWVFFMLLMYPVSSWTILITSVFNCVSEGWESLHSLAVFFLELWTCLLYTSDAADDQSRV